MVTTILAINNFMYRLIMAWSGPGARARGGALLLYILLIKLFKLTWR
jgi:hypothetical protein